MKQKEIKVEVRFTEGYERRYTEACLGQLRKREAAKEMEKEAGCKLKKEIAEAV